MSVGVTQSELDRRTRSKLSEAGVQFFTPQNLLDWHNEAQDVISAEAPFAGVSTWTTVMVKNQPSYLLPVEMIEPTASAVRESSGRLYRLKYEESDRVDETRAWWNGSANRPTRCAYRMTTEGPAVDLWPAPNAAFDLVVEGHRRATTLTAGTDRTDIPPWLVQSVVSYAVWQAKVKDEEEGQADRARSQFERDMADLYERRMLIQSDQIPTLRPSRAIGGSRWLP